MLRVIYGIKLKWELHGEYVTWREGKISKRMGSPVMPLRKACTPSLDDPQVMSNGGHGLIDLAPMRSKSGSHNSRPYC